MMNGSKLAALLAAGAAALALSPTPLAAQEAAKRISLGMAIDHMADDQTEGGEVTAMLPDRTGAALGFKVGDIIIEAGGKPISGAAFREYMQARKPGDELVFKVKRGDSVLVLKGIGLAASEGAPTLTAQPQE
jgi:S1-C subfamily serine protease